MNRPKLIHIAVLAPVHLLVALTSNAISFSMGSPRFDHPDLPMSMVERICGMVAGILSQPGAAVWGLIPNRHAQVFLEWPITMLNSVLWAVVIALVLARLTSHSSRTQRPLSNSTYDAE